MSRLVAVLGRVATAAAGAVAAGSVAAAFEARGAAELGNAPLGATFFATLGLLTPFALALGVFAGVALAIVVSEPTRASLRAWFSPADASERSERSVLLALAPPAFLLWLLASAGTALSALVVESKSSAHSAGVAAAVSVFGLSLGAGVFALSRRVGQRVAVPLAPLPMLLVSCAVTLLTLVVIVRTGEPSGSGGPLSLFGVLVRDELDLRPVWLLALMALGALVAPLPRSWLWIGVCALVSFVPPLFLFRVADEKLGDESVSLAVERSAPLSGKLVAPLRKSMDGDRDGYSARFGGGDCDDANPARNPGADDVPGNGIDEDCSGSDARESAKKPAEAPVERAEARASLPEGLNVVLITIDTLRYDLGYLGATRPISPKLDELARESVVFERAYSLASYTSKSLPPMLIGKYCAETHRGYAHFNRFETRDTFIAERLKAAGVVTESVQGHWYFSQNYGMERGFSNIDTSAQPKAAQAEGDRTSTSEKLSDATIERLSRPELAAKPFFLWVHYTDPHAEYVPHEGFDFGTDSRARYDGEVAYVDHHVGRVLEALRKGPHWDKTAVIVTSDHGEAFGEHGMIRHGFELWEELVRVPLIVRVPGVPSRRVTVRRSVIDLVPTLLDLYRLPPPSGQGSDFTSGHSLVPDLFAEKGAEVVRPILVDMPQGPHNAERSAYIDGDQKLITSGGRALGLYDLAQDPAEKQNLLKDRERVRAALDNYKAFRRSLKEVYVRPTP